MYVPAHFAQDDTATLHALIRAFPFAMLVTAPRGVPFATHLPMLFDPAMGAKGALIGHLARANPQVEQLRSGFAPMAVFSGPQGYVSPSWYSSDDNVPTWNYAAVHVYGRASLIEDATRLGALVERLTNAHEARFAEPWKFDREGAGSKLLRAITGIEIQIERIEGKWKLGQNKTEEDQAGVIAGLRAGETAGEDALAAFMEKSRKP